MTIWRRPSSTSPATYAAYFDDEGHTPTFLRAALRVIPKCLPFLWPGYLAAVFTQHRLAFHDLIARTMVVRSVE